MTISIPNCAGPRRDDFKGETSLPTADDIATYFRERKLMAVVFAVDSACETDSLAFPTRSSSKRPRSIWMCSSRSAASTR